VFPPEALRGPRGLVSIVLSDRRHRRELLLDECGPASHEVEGIGHEDDPEHVDGLGTEPLLLMPNYAEPFSIYQWG
jgi:hypothetical protein